MLKTQGLWRGGLSRRPYSVAFFAVIFAVFACGADPSRAAPRPVPAARAQRTTADGGQRADPNYDTSVANPAYPYKHRTILFDDSHDNFHVTTGRYKPFVDLMRNDGYRIVSSRGEFKARTLADCDVLVTVNAINAIDQQRSAFTDHECGAVRDWVSRGGALLLITDMPPWGAPGASLAAQFGVQMSKGIVFDPANASRQGLLFSREKSQLANHPITQGRDNSERVNTILTFDGQSLIGPEGSVALLKFADTAVDFSEAGQVSAAGRAQGVALKWGKGRVVVLGEAAQVSAQIYGGNPSSRMGMNVSGCDNRQMTLNMMHWLSRLID